MILPSEHHSSPRSYWIGFAHGAGLPAVILAATFVGIGSVCRDFGFSLPWTLLACCLIWAGPAQLILVSGLGLGASPIAVALAVTLSSVRLLPMVVSIMPYLRAAHPRRPALYLCGHLVAISMWVEGLRLLPNVPVERRIPFYLGLGSALILTSMVAAFVGHQLASSMPVPFAAGLLFLTPVFFLLSLLRNAKDRIDRFSIVAGFFGLLAASPFGGGFELFFAGVGGGTLAYLVARGWSPFQKARDETFHDS